MAENPQAVQKNPRFELALSFTGVDEDKARRMVSGEYKDILVLKAKFAIPDADLHCNLVAFANTETGLFLNISLIVYSNVQAYESADPASPWRDYYRSCEKIAKSVQIRDTPDFLVHLKNSLAGYELVADMRTGDVDSAAFKVGDIAGKFFGLKDIDSIAGLDVSSSIELAEQRISIAAAGSASPDNVSAEPADTRPEIEKKTQFVVPAKAIISPLKGKMVKDLVKGDRIMILFEKRDAVSLKIAESLGALNEDRQYTSIKARIVEKVPVEKIGFWIYAAIAKNAVAKIEEEGNVQIEMVVDWQDPNAVVAQKEAADRNIIMYIALLIGLIAIAGLIIYAIV
jgi:hypothetical protein